MPTNWTPSDSPVAFLRFCRTKNPADAVGGIEHTIAVHAAELARRGWQVLTLVAGHPSCRERLARFFVDRQVASVELDGQNPFTLGHQVRAAVLARGIHVLIAENHREAVAASLGLVSIPAVALLWRHHTLPKPRGALRMLTPPIDRVLLDRVTAHVVVSQGLGAELPRCRRVRAPVIWVPNGIDSPSGPADPITSSVHRPLPRRVALVGRIDGNKGHDVVLHALSTMRVPGVQAVFIGDGCRRRAVEDLAARLHLEAQVTFHGQLAEPWKALQNVEVIVLPSANEGSPLVLLEAFARKKLVVASAVGAVGELVEHDRTGFLIPPGDPRALAEALAHIFERPSAEFLRHRMHAYERYRERHTVEISAARLEEAILAVSEIHCSTQVTAC